MDRKDDPPLSQDFIGLPAQKLILKNDSIDCRSMTISITQDQEGIVNFVWLADDYLTYMSNSNSSPVEMITVLKHVYSSVSITYGGRDLLDGLTTVSIAVFDETDTKISDIVLPADPGKQSTSYTIAQKNIKSLHFKGKSSGAYAVGLGISKFEFEL